MKEPLMKVKQVAARLSVSIPEAYRLLHSGAIPLVRVGERSIRARTEDVEAYIRRQRKTA